MSASLPQACACIPQAAVEFLELLLTFEQVHARRII
jgi:hypothetical protein